MSEPDTTTCCPPKKPAAAGCCSPTEPAAACCPPPVEKSGCSPPAEPKAACCTPPEPTGSCCPPAAADTGCCPDRSAWERPGYRLWPFVCGWLETPVGPVPQVTTRLERDDTLGAWQMRWGLGRDRYSIAPGLYAVGAPDAEAPVLVTANYKLSFDALRRELGQLAAWILVLDTRGINVWCAAGKGTFGTAEVIRRVKAARLEQLVSHRRLILPQLGAPGVAAHEVVKGCGFRVSYGPVRAVDLPAYLNAGGKATPAMRRVSFSARERLVLAPVELVMMKKASLWALLVLLLLGGIGPQIFSFGAMFGRGGAAFGGYLLGVLAGAVLTPLLLPWIPGTAFALKGALVGGGVALLGILGWGDAMGLPASIALLLALPAVASWCAMNFTGSTSFTSPSGVEKEMRRAMPLQGISLLLAGICWIWGAFI